MPQDSDFPLPVGPSLAGRLLVAGPELLEPTFRRTVVLLAQHDPDQGALGFILNRPIGKRVGDLLPTDPLPALDDVGVYFGGPVGQQHLTFAAFRWDTGRRVLEFRTHLSADEAGAMRAEGREVRGFVGYSGWSPGQLEGELEARAWEVQRPSGPEIVDPASCPGIWARLIGGISPWHRIAADAPDDLSLN
jgi:putative transcriptional regulator